jgi:tRNA-5-taurinomethyluridine 2-sulfurtransferase
MSTMNTNTIVPVVEPSKPTVAVGLSGGVDSAVTAALLQRTGHRVVGVFMRNWNEIEETGQCAGEADERDARAICEHLKIPFRRVDFIEEYWNEVFERFLAWYEGGATPNPDVWCNQFIKFRAFASAGLEHADILATGHYARVLNAHTSSIDNVQVSKYLEEAGASHLVPTQHATNQRHPVRVNRMSTVEDVLAHYKSEQYTRDAILLRGADWTKDQSYFLSYVSANKLRNVSFPLGNLYKSQVRQLAQHWGLLNARKRDSVGICFIGKRKFSDFLENYITPRSGPIIDFETGRVLAEHRGAWNYTIGQNARVSVGSDRWFVLSKNMETNEVFVVNKHDHALLMTGCVRVGGVHWVAGQAPDDSTLQSCQVSLRYQHNSTPCSLHPSPTPSPTVLNVLSNLSSQLSQSPDTDMSHCDSVDYTAVLTQEQSRAVTPGQVAAFYDGIVCLGGGSILEAMPPPPQTVRGNR